MQASQKDASGWTTCPQCGSGRPASEPKFGATKTGQLHTIDITDETVRLLRDHKCTQAELKMANRKDDKDYGLVVRTRLVRCP